MMLDDHTLDSQPPLGPLRLVYGRRCEAEEKYLKATDFSVECGLKWQVDYWKILIEIRYVYI